MPKAPLPENEIERLKILDSYEILDTTPEEAFDDLTALASQICGTPIALVSMVAENRQWFKSRYGLDTKETPREMSFCTHTILQDDVFVVSDATRDERFAGNQLVTSDPNIKFYAGVPLKTTEGHALGTLCVIDRIPRSLSPQQTKALKVLGHQVLSRLELRQNLKRLEDLMNERQKAEAFMRETENKYRALRENASDGILVLEPSGVLVEINARICEMLGFIREELLGSKFNNLIPAEDLETTPDRIDEVLEGKPLLIERRLRKKDGSEIITELSAREFPGNKVYASVRDITERKRNEEIMARLASMVESSNDAIIGKSLDGVITNWNRGATILYGYSAKEVIGQRYSILTPPDRQDEIPSILEKIKNGDHVQHLETVRLKKDSQLVNVSVSVSPLISTKSKIIGCVTIARDITQRKQMEAELRSAHDEALESVRLKSEFLANMSHEIRTPMNGVIGMTEILLETSLSPEQKDYVETIRSSGENLVSIINNILDFSKIEAGKVELEEIDLNLRNVIEETVEPIVSQAQKKGVEIAHFIYRDVPTDLIGDPQKLRQVLTNLLGNAIKFTERGEVILRISKEYELNEKVRIRFAVTDTGIGINEEARKRLFQPFMQADGSVTRQFGGTGLGLAISKRLVESMKGEIGVESEVGQGSTFWFTAEFGKQSGKAFETIINQKNFFEGLKVLVIDDNETNRKILQHCLASWGAHYTSISSAEKALEEMLSVSRTSRRYDVAILDMQMPKMHSLTLAGKIKNEPEIADTPLILLTSIRQQYLSGTDNSSVVSAILTKPIKQDELFDCLKNVLSENKRETESTATIEETSEQIQAEEISKPKARVLAVEDNDVNQKVILRQLSQLGYQSDLATNGEEALKTLEKNDYDIVLMDCQMPVRDGYSTASEIRRREQQSGKHIPIIAMTAHALPGDREKCLAAGMDDFISKPIRQKNLAQLLARFTNQQMLQVFSNDAQSSKQSNETEFKDAESVKSAINELAENDQDFASELIKAYIFDTTERLNALTPAVEKNDLEMIKNLSHSIKGSSATLGAVTMASLSEEFESIAQSGSLQNVNVLLENMNQEFSNLKTFLQNLSKSI
ncbi:MAG: PAS domain S-box protein [Pyrinomonadaceae bacterium]